MSLLLKNAHIICPVQKIDDAGFLVIKDGHIAAVGTGAYSQEQSCDEVIDLKGACVSPGLVDMRVQSADPGAEHLETVDSLLAAAAASGVTSLISLPDTNPVIDNAAMIDSLLLRSSRLGWAAFTSLRCPDKGAKWQRDGRAWHDGRSWCRWICKRRPFYSR